MKQTTTRTKEFTGLGIPGERVGERVSPIIEAQISTSELSTWGVLVYNNDINTFAEVISILMAATSCSLSEATYETSKIHTEGSAYVHFDTLEACVEVHDIVKSIGIRVLVVENP